MRLAALGCAEVCLRGLVCNNDLRLAVDAAWLAAAIIAPQSLDSTVGDDDNGDGGGGGGGGGYSDGNGCGGDGDCNGQPNTKGKFGSSPTQMDSGGVGDTSFDTVDSNDDIAPAPAAVGTPLAGPAGDRRRPHTALVEAMCLAGLVRGLAAKGAQALTPVLTPVLRCLGHVLSHDSEAILASVVRDWPLGQATAATPGPTLAASLSEWLASPVPAVVREATHVAQVLAGGSDAARDLLAAENGSAVTALAAVVSGGGFRATRTEAMFALLNLAADRRFTADVVALNGVAAAITGDLLGSGGGSEVDRAALHFAELALCCQQQQQNQQLQQQQPTNQVDFIGAIMDDRVVERIENLAAGHANASDQVATLAGSVADLISARAEAAEAAAMF
jgi:hypothetical protein